VLQTRDCATFIRREYACHDHAHAEPSYNIYGQKRIDIQRHYLRATDTSDKALGLVVWDHHGQTYKTRSTQSIDETDTRRLQIQWPKYLPMSFWKLLKFPFHTMAST
jgi:hypothetical protein